MASTVVARDVYRAVEVLLTRNLIALARVRVAVGAAECIRMLLIVLIASAGRADILAPCAWADALIGPLIASTAGAADAGVGLLVAAAAEALATDAVLLCAPAATAVPAVEVDRGDADAVADVTLAVVARLALALR